MRHSLTHSRRFAYCEKLAYVLTCIGLSACAFLWCQTMAPLLFPDGVQVQAPTLRLLVLVMPTCFMVIGAVMALLASLGLMRD